MGLEAIFAGKMLGDGHLNISGPGRRPRLAFGHTLNDREYAYYCYRLFSEYIPFNPHCKNQFKNYDKRTGKTYHRIYYQSKNHRFLDMMYNFWYYKGQKIIPHEWLKENLSKEGLALWYQDDGSLKNNGDRIIISTESFSNDEISFLKEFLLDKFKIHVSVDSQNRLDISSRKEVRKFQALVEPWLHHSMERKSIKEKWLGWQTSWYENKDKKDICRTTIYLSFEIYELVKREGYSELLNTKLDNWLDEIWKEIQNFANLYQWINENKNIPNIRNYKITPRLRQHIKHRLDILSMATGFEKSELVTLALMDS